jgi:glycosyltransferase involved in cell wall biosynthesis
MGRRPRVLVVSQFYLPAFRAGGPVRTLASLVERLGAEIEFAVLTGDRDLGDRAPFAGLPVGVWTDQGGHRVMHVRGAAGVAAALRREPYDLLYVNSVFSRRFGILPLVLRRAGLLPARPLVLAARGELSSGALGLHRRRKRAFLRAARVLGLLRGVRWQASSAYEAREIRGWFGEDAAVAIAPNLTPAAATWPPAERPPKQPGRLRLAFLSRIAPMKNLLGAIELLDGVEGQVALDVYGPVEDQAYWQRCRAAIARLPTGVEVNVRGPVTFGAATEVLAGYDALLLPTLGENFGHVVLEALAAGCPVIVSDRTPWRDLQERGVGWDLPLEAPERFRAVLSECARMGPAEHSRLSEAARAYAAEVTADPASEEATRRLLTEP